MTVDTFQNCSDVVAFKNVGPWSSRVVFMGRAGSYAYGTRTPESDVDFRGVFLAAEANILGMSPVETYTEQEPNDLQCFEIRHFAKLCLKGSPLQLEMLYYPAEAIVTDSHWAWRRLVGIRDAFIGKHLKATLGGFAQGDIKRIEGGSTAKCGAKGKMLIEKYGYNTKHASNAWRLLKMAEILFTTGQFVVRLPDKDREEIIAIKKGKYPKEEFLNYVRDEDKRIFELADKADLPSGPDFHRVEDKIIEIYKDSLK